MIKQCGKKDIGWISSMMQDEDVFNGCAEDGMERKNTVSYVKTLIGRDDVVVLCLVPGKMIHTFVRRTGVMWDIHTAISKKCELKGKERVKMTIAACTWMIKSKGARKFTTHVPEGNRAAGIYAIACGLERCGVLTSSIHKNGRLVDMTIYQTKDEDVLEILRSN
jgi:hypothetical protein